MAMVDYNYYMMMYGGDAVFADDTEFATYARDAAAHLDRYKRLYTVTPTAPDSERMAICAMIDTLYYYAALQNGDIAASVSVGSVRTTRVQALPDVSPKAQSRALYRSACLYLDIDRRA